LAELERLDVDLMLVRPDDAADAQWEDQVNDLAATVTRWLGNDTRVLEFTEHEIATSGDTEPVLDDVAREGLTVAGTRSWLTQAVAERKLTCARKPAQRRSRRAG
jgi:hypothetical protein